MSRARLSVVRVARGAGVRGADMCVVLASGGGGECGAGERGLEGDGALRGALAWALRCGRGRALVRRSIDGPGRDDAPEAVVWPWVVVLY